VSIRPSVRLFVSLSQVGVLLKWLNTGTRNQKHMIAQGLGFQNPDDYDAAPHYAEER